MLVAPKSGEELREDIARRSGQIYDKAADYVSNARDEAEHMVNQGKIQADKIVSSAKSQAENLMQNASK